MKKSEYLMMCGGIGFLLSLIIGEFISNKYGAGLIPTSLYGTAVLGFVCFAIGFILIVKSDKNK